MIENTVIQIIFYGKKFTKECFLNDPETEVNNK